MQSNLSQPLDRRISLIQFLQLLGGVIITPRGIASLANKLTQPYRNPAPASELTSRQSIGLNRFGA